MGNFKLVKHNLNGHLKKPKLLNPTAKTPPPVLSLDEHRPCSLAGVSQSSRPAPVLTESPPSMGDIKQAFVNC
ncbi:hypothetical protein L6452_21358 [Arctium lappa]|uniref:Uncharacterized protein n=1 Tax=Arctium lappa TaxID=4217 RepID=A0ACB9BD45_ARCLA|nr:hypothetical protein L6452_21358 [Arctium lappa]